MGVWVHSKIHRILESLESNIRDENHRREAVKTYSELLFDIEYDGKFTNVWKEKRQKAKV